MLVYLANFTSAKENAEENNIVNVYIPTSDVILI